MKKVKLLLFIFGVFFFVGTNNVLALTNTERKDIMLKQLDDYKFDFKYVDMTDNYKLIKENGFELSYINIPNWFLSGLVRSELDNVISLENTDAIDLFCYQKGDEYTDYTEEGEITKVRENDGCGISIYLGYEGEGTDNVVVNTTINGSFTKVEGDSKNKKEAISLVEKIIDNVYVADVDILNHYVNYKSNSTTFFESNNALLEFANLKKMVEDNPDYDFSVGYQDTRRGDAYVSYAEGCTYIMKDGIVYGFTINTYSSANMFFVPVGTKLEDYGKVLEKKLNDYINDDSVKIKILPFDEKYNNFLNYPNAEVSYIWKDNLNIDIDNYYKKVGTNSEKELAKLNDEYGIICDKCVVMQSYQMFINDTRYEIGIAEMDEETLNKFGTILSKDSETGIILKTNAGNVPLDAKLKVETFELTKEEKEKLESLGYTSISAYNFELYSAILDKIIHNFSDVTDILIPLEGNKVADNLKVIYLADNLKDMEIFGTKVVEYEGNKYLQFSTKHFSNYVVVEDAIDNPDTGDNIFTYFITFILSGLVLIYLFKYTRKKVFN